MHRCLRSLAAIPHALASVATGTACLKVPHALASVATTAFHPAGAVLFLRAMLAALLVAVALPEAQAEWGDLEITFTAEESLASSWLDTSKTMDPFCKNRKVPDESLVIDPQTKGVANVLIWLSGEPSRVHESYAKLIDKPLTIDFKDCRIEPHVATLFVGQPLRLTQSDPAGHNIKMDPFDNVGIGVLIPFGGEYTYQEFKRPEALPVKIGCSIHSWMSSYLLVQKHPYMGVSGRDGKLVIRNLPAGEQEFIAWLEPKYLQQVVVDGKKTSWKRGRFKVDVPSGGMAKINVVALKRP